MNPNQSQRSTKKTKKIAKNNNKIQNKQHSMPSAGAKAVRDSRFQSAKYDPKFQISKANLGKVKIDKRFADKMKTQKFKLGGQIDKYGRKVVQSSKLAGMSDYYYTQQEQQQRNSKDEQQIDQPIVHTSKNKKDNKQSKKNKNKNKKEQEQEQEYKQKQIDQNYIQEDEQQEYDEQNNQQKYQNGISKWMENYNEQSSQQEQQDIDQLIEDADSVWSDDDKDVIKNQNVQVTKRLALCNYDWMNISAKDLMLLFSSFKPNVGTILSVNVYYSQFGKQKMKMEQQYGPQGIWSQKVQNKQQDEKSKNKNGYSQIKKNRKDQEAFNLRKLRAYQKQRLKYCYAVIQCNSKKTADQIYRECDGNQFQSSNIQFDLRFIPDSIKFDPKMLKEKCEQIPISGEVKNFVSRATGHSKVSLTWQDPQLNEIASLKKKNWNKMTQAQMDKIDWGVYIDEQNQQANDKFNTIMNRRNKNQTQSEMKEQNNKQNVTDWRRQCNKQYRKKSQQDDLQITFTSGFDKNIAQKQQKLSLNKQIKSRKQRWRKQQEEKKNRQHLQLLVEKSDKPQFKYNPEDERFKAVLNNPLYYIDPSNSKFDHRKTGAVFEQVVKNNRRKNLQ